MVQERRRNAATCRPRGHIDDGGPATIPYREAYLSQKAPPQFICSRWPSTARSGSATASIKD